MYLQQEPEQTEMSCQLVSHQLFKTHAFRLFSLLLLGLVLCSCARQGKSVEPYQEKARQPVAARQAHHETSSKSLPVVQSMQQEKDSAPGPVLSSDVLLPALTMVDDRIVAYEGKLAAWYDFSAEAAKIKLDVELQEKIESCQRRLLDILSWYNELHESLFRESSGQTADYPVRERLLAVERDDIAFLESDCQQIIKENQQSGSWIEGTRYKLLEESEKEIGERMASQDYQQVINLYDQLSLEDGRHPSFNTTFAYGQALLRTGRENEAEPVFLDLLSRIRQLNQIEREFKLMQLIADLNFGLEDYSRAFERYIDIINRYAGLGENVEWARKQQAVISSRNLKETEVKSFATLIFGYLSNNSERDGYKVVMEAEHFIENYPESPVLITVNRILLESRDKADAWFAGILEQLDLLRAEKKYDEALLLIEQLPRRDMLIDKQDHLTTIIDDLVSAQFEEAEHQRLALEDELKQTWNKGMSLLREREYDQAVELFKGLLGSQYDERANQKIGEAQRLAAQEDRRRAAELFVRASSTTDLDSKVKLLFASRELLRNILVKYPQSDLVDKVKRNLNRIEEEIMALDPSLLLTPTGDNEPMDSESSPGYPVMNRDD